MVCFNYCKHLLFTLICVAFGYTQSIDFEGNLDSIRKLRELSKNENLDKTIRLNHAKTAQQLAYKLDIDSVTFNTNLCLAKVLWDNRLFLDSKKLNQKNLKLALKVDDSVNLAKLHLNIGRYYRGKTNLIDSALHHFYISKKIATQIKYTFGVARVLLNIAIVQKNHKDFAASEANSFKALALLKSLPRSKETKKIEIFTHNSLGLLYCVTKEYDASIKHYKHILKSEYFKKNDQKNNLDFIKSNLGMTYKRMGKYKKALSIFDSILLNKNLKKKQPSLYTLAMGNRCETLLLSKQKLKQAYYGFHSLLNFIKKNKNLTYRSYWINRELSKYHYHFKHKDSAKYYAYKAKTVADTYYKDDVLGALLNLTKIEDDSIAVKHYDAYIKLSDSLLQEERLNRNKFARIQFETDTYIEENEKLEERNTLISVFSIIAIVILLLLFVIANQIAKNQKLKFEQAQQQANADIYNLMLNEQHKIQEGRLNERYHIAEELHDGVLNTLAGTRMGIEYLSTLYPEAIKKYELYITELQKTERDIRNLSHSLKHSKLDAQQGFMSIVKTYVENTSKLHRFECNITEHQDIDWKNITDLTKVNLFRILQEALHNVAKHANASTVNISFNLYDNEKLQITITDNGNGFDTSQKAEGIGLQNIQSRCERLRGQCEISTVIGKGTTLTVNLPV